MKIIGQTSEGFLVSATGDELARLAGHYGEGSAASHNIQFKPGDELNVSVIYKAFYELSQHGEYYLDSTIRDLKTVLTSLETIEKGTIVKVAEFKDEIKGYKD